MLITLAAAATESIAAFAALITIVAAASASVLAYAFWATVPALATAALSPIACILSISVIFCKIPNIAANLTSCPSAVRYKLIINYYAPTGLFAGPIKECMSPAVSIAANISAGAACISF